MPEACKRVGFFALIALAGWTQALGAEDAGEEPIDALTLATKIQDYVLDLPDLDAKATPEQLARAVEAGKLFDKAYRRRDELEASIQALLGHLGVKAGYFSGDARVLLAGAKLLWRHTDKAKPALSEASVLAWACILAGDPKPAIEALTRVTAKRPDPKVALWAKGLMPVITRCHRPVRLNFKLLDGTAIRSAQLHGRVVVLDFWASYADPYKLVLPDIVKFYEQRRKDKLFVMVGLSWDDTLGAAKRGIREFGQRWPQGRDNGLGKKLGLKGVPQMVVLSADGRIIFQGHPVAMDRIRWVVDFALRQARRKRQQARPATSPASRPATPERPGPRIQPAPAVQSRPAGDPSPAAAAERKYRLAQAYANAGLAKKAKDVLREILRDYPDTPAAGKAREALNRGP